MAFFIISDCNLIHIILVLIYNLQNIYNINGESKKDEARIEVSTKNIFIRDEPQI